jgi:Tfp pilus assembly protein PilN
MAIGPLEMNGIYSRTQDMSIIAQNEDNKAMLHQSAFGQTVQKNAERQMNEVQETGQTDTRQRKQDAKEKGKNEYFGDGGRRRRQTGESPSDGRVVRKEGGHFDFSV